MTDPPDPSNAANTNGTSEGAAPATQHEPAAAGQDHFTFGNPPPSPEVETPAQRRLRYLWQPPGPASVGRRASLRLSDVVTAATEIADDSGLAEVSMRKVASRLGIAPMSLYTYLPGKDELMDHMIDAAYAELRLPPATAPWDAALRTQARERRDMYLRHPWLLDVNPARLPLAPHVLDADEAALAAVAQLGLPARESVEVSALITSFVRDQARAHLVEAAESESSGSDNDEYWQGVTSFWSTYFDPQRYPTMLSVWDRGGFDAGDASFDEALERLLSSLTR